MRRRYLHMSVPGRLLPLHVLLTGRHACCGARWRASHLDGCARHPWSSREGGHLREPSDGTPGPTADRLEGWCASSRSARAVHDHRRVSHS